VILGLPEWLQISERWEDTAPADLVPAIQYLRRRFLEAHWKRGDATREGCYAELHRNELDDVAEAALDNRTNLKRWVDHAVGEMFDDLVNQGTPSAVLKAYFHLYLDGLAREIITVFRDLVVIGHAHRMRLATSPFEWAQAQAKHLIRSEAENIAFWVIHACDELDDRPWGTWQSPHFIVMKPSGNHPFDAETAWNRSDPETSTQWLKWFGEAYVLHLEKIIEETAGMTALEFAKTQPASEPEAPMFSSESNVAPAPIVKSARRELRKQDTQARYELWRKKYKELKKRPDMPDVWYADQIAGLAIGGGYNVATIRKHMTK